MAYIPEEEFEDIGDGWQRRGDIVSKMEDNNLHFLDLKKARKTFAFPSLVFGSSGSNTRIPYVCEDVELAIPE